MSYEMARAKYLAAIRASIVIDQLGFGPAMDAAWHAVEHARDEMIAAAASQRLVPVFVEASLVEAT